MFNRFFKGGIYTLGCALVGVSFATPAAADPPSFFQSVLPSTAAINSVARLTYTIDNTGAGVVTDLAFTATLPTGVELAPTPDATTSCLGAGSAAAADLLTTAPGTIAFSNGEIGGASTCTVSVNIIGTTAAGYTLPQVTLTSSEVDAQTDTIPFTATTAAPTLSLAAAPSMLNLGDTTTLTFTFDNSLNVTRVGNLDFTATLPVGLEIANPSNATTDCVSSSAPSTVFAPTPGGQDILLDADGSTLFPGFEVLSDGATCSATVDVLATGTGDFTVTVPSYLADFTSFGGAATSFEVEASELNISATVLNTPVNAGTSAEVEFVIQNINRTNSATAVGFTADPAFFSPFISGMTASLVSSDCGGTVIDGAALQLSGGTIAPEGSCTVRADFSVDAATGGGAYQISVTTPVSGTVAGVPVTGNTTNANFSIPIGGVAPLITVEFLEPGTLSPNPTPSAGDDVILRTTITNGSLTSAASDLTADIKVVPPLPFPLSAVLPSTPCGASSSVALTSPGIDEQNITLFGGELASAPNIGASCTFDTTLTISSGTAPGVYTVMAEGPTATIGGGTVSGAGASASLTIGAGLNLNLGKAFLSAAFPGDTVDMELTVANVSDTADVQGIAFTDDVNAMLAGTTVASIQSDSCNGTPSGIGTGSFGYSGGTLSASTTCSIVVRLNIPVSATVGTFINTTSDLVAEPAGGGTSATFAAASADLDVSNATFTKEFLTASVIPGGTSTLRYQIENLDPSNPIDITFFTDNLADAIPGFQTTGPASVNTCGGGFAGTTFITYTGGQVPAGSTCTIEAEVLVPLSAVNGTFGSTTSNLILVGPLLVDPASAQITVESTQIELVKEFTDDPIVAGTDVNLRYTISNLSTSDAVSDIAFTDDLTSLPTGTLFSATTADGCSATIAGTGTNNVVISGVGLGAGASCVIDLAISVPGSAASGSSVSTTSDLTGTIGGLLVTGAAATDTLVINDLALTFDKAFSPDTLPVSGTTTLTYTITNTSGSAATSLAFTEDIDAIATGATLSNFQSTCTGATGTGTSLLTFDGATVAGGSSCTASVDIAIPVSATAGAVTSTSSALTSNGLEVAPAASAGLTILTGADLAVTKTDGVTTVDAGNTVTYTIVASNNGPAPDPSVSLTDTFSSDLACTYTSVAAGGATGNTAAGAGDLAETLSMPSGSSVTYTASCTVSITAAAGTLTNTADITASIADPDPANNSATDNDTVIVPVTPPSFGKAFGPATVVQGGTSTVTLTIDNSAAGFAATGLDVTDNLPTGMVIATPSSAATTCSGGTVTATAGASVASYTGGTVAAGGTCTVTFDVVALSGSTLTNTTLDLTSLFGNSGTATADLTVTPAPAPTFAKTYTPNAIEVGDATTVAIVVDNTAALVAATGGSFTYTFPPELTFATPANPVSSCSSGSSTFTSFSTTANSISVTGLDIAGGDTCTFGLDLQATGVNASISSTTTELITSLGTSGTASASLAVSGGPAPAISGAYAPDTVDPGDMSTLTFTVTNNSTFIEATGAGFTFNLPSGMAFASPDNAATTCSAGTATASGNTLTFAGGTLPVNGDCTVSVDVLATANDTVLTSFSSSLVTDFGSSGASFATVALTVNAATEPVLAKTFSPSTIAQGEVSTLTYSVMNGAGIGTGIMTINETLTGGAVLADPPNVSGTCGATTSASAGDASFDLTGFLLPPSANCDVTVDVISLTVGDTTTSTDALQSDIGGSTPLVATLTTEAAPTPTVAVDFDLASVVQGGSAVLTIDINNTAAIDATNIAFDDNLPTGMFPDPSASVVNNCGGTFTTNGISEIVSLVNSTLTAGNACDITIPVIATEVGTNTYEVNATSDLGTSAAASDSIEVTAAPIPTLTADFSPDTIEQGGGTTLTVFFENSASLVDATDLTATIPLLSGFEELGTGSFTTDCVGLTQSSGAIFAVEGGTITAGTDCSASIELRALEDGSFTQPTGDVTTSLGTSPSVDSNTLTVNAANSLGYTIAINPGTVTQGNSATVTVTLDNSANVIDASDAAFTVSLGGTMEVAALANGSTTCSAGTVTATAGSNSASLSGGTITFGQSCEVSFDVTSLDAGSFTATLGDLTTDVANTTGGATASLTVDAAPAPDFNQSYAPSTIGQGETSRLTLEVDNSASGLVANQVGSSSSTSADALGFSVTLPSGLSIEPNPNTSNSCGGMVTAEGNGTTVTLAGGRVEAASTCTVQVDVTSTTEGTLGPVTGSLTSNRGGSNLSAPTTPLEVTDNPFGSVTFVQNSVLDGTFNFASSEASLTFDIAVSGGSGTYGPVALDAGTYMVTQTRPSDLANATLVCGDGNTTVDVAEGSVTLVIDDGDNFTCTWGAANSVQDTVEAINSFLQRRNNLILSNGPSSARRMARLNQGVDRSRALRFQNGDLGSATPFTFDFTTIGSGNYKFSTSLQQVERSRRMFMLMVDGVEDNVEVYTPPRWDVWFEATFAAFNATQSDGHFAIAHLGADYLVNEDVLLGFAVQYDSMDQGDDGGETVEGTGWMAGPYVTARIAENLIFDGRIAYGQSSNTYDPKTTYVDKFDSDRFLIEATLSGSFDWDNWVVTPNFSMAYIEDTAESYVNGLGLTIPEQKVSLGQIRFGPTFSTTFEGRNQTVISPTFGINAIYNFAETDGVTLVNDTSEETDGFRARIEAGVRITGRSGVQFEAGAHYDGIGQSDYESFGARLRLVVPLN